MHIYFRLNNANYKKNKSLIILILLTSKMCKIFFFSVLNQQSPHVMTYIFLILCLISSHPRKWFFKFYSSISSHPKMWEEFFLEEYKKFLQSRWGFFGFASSLLKNKNFFFFFWKNVSFLIPQFLEMELSSPKLESSISRNWVFFFFFFQAQKVSFWDTRSFFFELGARKCNFSKYQKYFLENVRNFFNLGARKFYFP